MPKLTFDEFRKQMAEIAISEFDFTAEAAESYYGEANAECWLDFYNDDMTPREAVIADLEDGCR